jgi:hypothetical protein
VSTKTSTFAGHLLHFAQSVDIVDDTTFESVRSVVYRYVRDQLDAQYCELLRETHAVNGGGDRVTLDTFWSSQDRNHHWDLKNPDGSHTNAITQAYAACQPLWIAGCEKEVLAKSGSQVDQLTGVEVSPYAPSYENAHTTVVIPLRFKHTDGVFLIETGRYIEATDVAKAELLQLGSALAILYELYEANTSQENNTLRALEDLRDLLDASKFPRLAKPHFFIAFSHEADQEVIGAITDVLDEFSDRAEFTNWRHMTESGSITSQISQEIGLSKFGICYLSQPIGTSSSADGAEGVDYLDNPNVVFEAGMLHARTSADETDKSGEPCGWIPIREAKSVPAPFDFSTLRTLQVPRIRNGALNEESFKSELRQRMKSLLSGDGARG